MASWLTNLKPGDKVVEQNRVFGTRVSSVDRVLATDLVVKSPNGVESRYDRRTGAEVAPDKRWAGSLMKFCGS